MPKLKLTIRNKVRLLILLWLVGGMAMLVCAGKISEWFLLGVLALFFYVAHKTQNILCPHCEHPVLLKKYDINGLKGAYWSPIVNDVCPNCNKVLDNE